MVHPSGPYSPLAESVADDCKKRLNYMEETAYTTTLFRFYLFQIIRRSHTKFIFKTLTEIDCTVIAHVPLRYANDSDIRDYRILYLRSDRELQRP